MTFLATRHKAIYPHSHLWYCSPPLLRQAHFRKIAALRAGTRRHKAAGSEPRVGVIMDQGGPSPRKQNAPAPVVRSSQCVAAMYLWYRRYRNRKFEPRSIRSLCVDPGAA